MIRALITRSLLITLLTSCVSVPRAAAMNGPDPEKLATVTFDISGKQLLLPLPNSYATKDLDGVRQPVLNKIDMNSRVLPVKLLDEMWDWRGLLHLYGSLGVKIYIETVGPSFDLTCRGSLEKMLREKFAAKSERDDKSVLPAFQTPPDILGGRVVSYRWVDFNQHKNGENDEESFVIALSPKKYLTLRVNYYGGGDPSVKPSDWLPQAEAVKNAILHGARLEGDWPDEHDCR